MNLKDKVRMDPSSIPQEVLEHTLSGECDRSLLPAILEALNISMCVPCMCDCVYGVCVC